MLTVVLPIGILLHLVCTLIFYSRQLGVVRADPLCPLHRPPQAARHGADLSPFEPYTGSGPGQPRLCQTAYTLRQAEDAVAICWGSLLLWGALLAVYVAREALRRTDRGIHLVGGSTVANYVDLLMVRETDGHDGLLHEARSTAFRRSGGLTLYVPPLPQSVVQKLGIVATDTHRRGSTAASRRTSAAGRSYSDLPSPVAPVESPVAVVPVPSPFAAAAARSGGYSPVIPVHS